MERKWSGGAEPRASRRPQSFGFCPGPINVPLSPYKYQTEGETVVFSKGRYRTVPEELRLCTK